MKTMHLASHQSGAITIFIAMTMLLLITSMVMTAHSLATVNQRSIGNVQSREEAISAAKLEIEKVVGSSFTSAPALAANAALPVDINNDGIAEYSVAIEVPVCERFTRADTYSANSVTMPGFTPGGAYNTVWRIRGTATDQVTGTSVSVTHRVRILLSQVAKEAQCA